MTPRVALVALLSAVAAASWNMNASCQPAQAMVSPQPAERLIDLQFSGGSAGKFVAAVRKAAGDANIVVIGDLESFQVPAIQLKSVDVWSALKVLRSVQIAGRGFMVNQDVPDTKSAQSAQQLPVYTVAVVAQGGRDQDTLIMDLHDVLAADVRAADVLSAIETALKLAGDGFAPAQVRFHEQTALLIARGHPQQMGTVQQVIEQVRQPIERQRQMEAQHQLQQHAAASAMQVQQDAQAQVQRLMQELRGLQEENARLRRELEAARANQGGPR